jgi:hypothetical protein
MVVFFDFFKTKGVWLLSVCKYNSLDILII